MIPRGLTARIAGFHPAGPGSTPGVGNPFGLGFVLVFLVLSVYAECEIAEAKG